MIAPAHDPLLRAVAQHISPVAGGVRPYQTALRRAGVRANADDVRARLRELGMLAANANAPADQARALTFTLTASGEPKT